MALSQLMICRNRQRPSRGPSNTRGRLHGIHFYSPEMKANLKKSVVIDFRSSGAKGQQWACPLVMLSPQNHIYITIISSVNTSGLQCVSAPEALHNSSLKPNLTRITMKISILSILAVLVVGVSLAQVCSQTSAAVLLDEPPGSLHCSF